MTMIMDSEKLNAQYNQNSVLTMPWIAWGPPGPLLGYGPASVTSPQLEVLRAGWGFGRACSWGAV